MDVPHLPASASGEEVAAALDEAGCAVVDELVAPAVMAGLLEELDAVARRHAGRHGRLQRPHTSARAGWSPARPRRRELVMHPLVLAATGQLLAHATSFQLHLTQVIAIGPASRRS